jgi:hypothetical protein
MELLMREAGWLKQPLGNQTLDHLRTTLSAQDGACNPFVKAMGDRCSQHEVGFLLSKATNDFLREVAVEGLGNSLRR